MQLFPLVCQSKTIHLERNRSASTALKFTLGITIINSCTIICAQSFVINLLNLSFFVCTAKTTESILNDFWVTKARNSPNPKDIENAKGQKFYIISINLFKRGFLNLLLFKNTKFHKKIDYIQAKWIKLCNVCFVLHDLHNY